jgi:hypothetical protein
VQLLLLLLLVASIVDVVAKAADEVQQCPPLLLRLRTDCHLPLSLFLSVGVLNLTLTKNMTNTPLKQEKKKNHHNNITI